MRSRVLPRYSSNTGGIPVSVRLLGVVGGRNVASIVTAPRFCPRSSAVSRFLLGIGGTCGGLSRLGAGSLPGVLLNYRLFCFGNVSEDRRVFGFALGSDGCVLVRPGTCLLGGDFRGRLLCLGGSLKLVPVVPRVRHFCGTGNFGRFLGFVGRGRVLARMGTTSLLSGSCGGVVGGLVSRRVVAFVTASARSLGHPPLVDDTLCRVRGHFSIGRGRHVLTGLSALLYRVAGGRGNGKVGCGWRGWGQ